MFHSCYFRRLLDRKIAVAYYDRGLLIENFLVTLAEALLGFAIGSVTAIFFAFAVPFADH